MKYLIKINSALIESISKGNKLTTSLDQDLLALICNVAGPQFYSLESVKSHLKKDQHLVLKREPQNQYDTLAVQVYVNDIQIGHIPRTKNETIARLMDGGKMFYGKITEVEIIGINYVIEINIYFKD